MERAPFNDRLQFAFSPDNEGNAQPLVVPSLFRCNLVNKIGIILI